MIRLLYLAYLCIPIFFATAGASIVQLNQNPLVYVTIGILSGLANLSVSTYCVLRYGNPLVEIFGPLRRIPIIVFLVLLSMITHVLFYRAFSVPSEQIDYINLVMRSIIPSRGTAI